MLNGGGPVNESGPVNRGFMDLKKEKKRKKRKSLNTCVLLQKRKEKAKHLSFEFFSLGVLGPFAEFSVSL